MKLSRTITYHVFTDYRDDWFDRYADALALFKEWAEEFGNARLYEEIHIGEEMDEENCLQSIGDFPW